MDAAYKLHVKLGVYEFNAEGPEAEVKDAYQQFLAAVTTLPEKPVAEPRQTPSTPSAAGASTPSTADRALLDRVFAVDTQRGIVSLRLLPSESTNREADAAILILYGFRVLLQQREVLVTRLNEGLRQSGITVERLDRFMGVYSNMFMRGGARSGGRYTLNNLGVQTAENWLKTKFE
jgi:hypothetical protein